MNKGLFITFEGIDGCGKSTQVNAVNDYLSKNNTSCIVTREPGGTPLAEKIREMILSNDNNEMVDNCELLLFFAARAQHVEELIKPSLSEGNTVLCDRFQEATFAYQGAGRGLELENLIKLNNFATGGLVPDLTFVFDVSVETAFERMAAAGRSKDRMENSSRTFFEDIRNGYLFLAQKAPERIKVLDGERSVQELTDEILTIINLAIQ